MVSESRQRLSERLYQNWLELNRKPGSRDLTSASPLTLSEEDTSDCELTNLSWLVGLDLDSLAATPNTGNGDSSEASGPVSYLGKSEEDKKWKSRPKKPTHTYSEMITMAINESPDKQMTVAGIYTWIRNNFSYYRNTSASWKNSVRHCLSTNKRFHRVPQSRDKLGKRFWRIIPSAQSLNSSASSNKRRFSKKRHSDGGILQAIRFIGRCETIESTGESQESDSFTESIYESVDESIDGSSITDLSSPTPSTDLFSPEWSNGTKLNDAIAGLSDLGSNPAFGLRLESSAFEPLPGNNVRQRFMNHLDSDFLMPFSLLTTDGTGHEDWTLTDLTHSVKPVDCPDDFSSYLFDSELSLRTIISEI